MALPNVYTDAELQMLADWSRAIDAVPGWLDRDARVGKPYPFVHLEATKETLTASAVGNDYWNPLWRDEEYAKYTRWGGIIANPFYTVYIHFSVPWPQLNVPEDIGFKAGRVWWEDNRFYHPVRVGDSFKIWGMRPELKDATDSDGSGPRIFRLTNGVKMISQRDEVVATRSRTMLITILPEREKWQPPVVAPLYRYTKEDLEAIRRLEDEETIRGAKPRYWEDVTVGDDVVPTVTGPITAWDSVVMIAAVGCTTIPMREVRRQTPDAIIVDPETGVSHKEIEIHLSEKVARMVTGQPISGGFEVMMTRAVTNWMGDDAFFRKLTFRMYGVMELGNTVFAQARVTKKYVEDGENLVDLVVWLETIKGFVAAAGVATGRLISREELEIRL